MLRMTISAPRLPIYHRLVALHKPPFDTSFREGLSKILNIELPELAWTHASLPISAGGLGIRSVASLAPSAFLASAAGTRDLQSSILGFAVEDADDAAFNETLSVWRERYNTPQPEAGRQGSQRQWDKASITISVNTLLACQPDAYNRARLLAVSAPHGSDWLYALPITSCGLRLDDEAIGIACGVRLGVSLCMPHLCVCGANVDDRGSHGLSCRQSACRIQRHQAINDLIYRAILKANFQATKEPSGLSRTDGKRPDGMTLTPWRGGRYLTWDVTVSDTLASSYLPQSSNSPGSMAEVAANKKMLKYSVLALTYEFCIFLLAATSAMLPGEL